MLSFAIIVFIYKNGFKIIFSIFSYLLHCLNILFCLCPFHFAFISSNSRCVLAQPGWPVGISRLRGAEWGDQQEHSACAGSSRAASAGLHQHQPEHSVPSQRHWEGGREKEHSLLGLVSWTPARGSPRHTFWLLICAAVLSTTSPCPAGVGCCAQPCSVKSGIANVHHPLGFGAGCVPDTLGLQDDTGLLTMSSVFTQDRGTESLCEILAPVGAVGCFASRLLHRVPSRSDCCPLVQPGSCSRVKIEGFLFQNSSRAGGLSPMHLPNQNWHLFSLPV